MGVVLVTTKAMGISAEWVHGPDQPRIARVRLESASARPRCRSCLDMKDVDMAEFDVVVVGSGTGLLAAIAAADAGLSVLVVEKGAHLGGNTALSGGGFWIPNNAVLRKHKIPDSRERAGVYLESLLGDSVPRARWEAFLDLGPDAVDLMLKYVPNTFEPMWEYPDYFTEVPGGSPRGRAVESSPVDAKKLGADRDLIHPTGMAAPVPMPVTGIDYKWMNLVTRSPKGGARIAKRVAQGLGGMAIGREYMAGGQALAAGLIYGARKAGVQWWLNSPVVDLLQHEGRVTGVVVERDGQRTEVSARKGVILASGGFERNADMRKQYQSEVLDGSWSMGAPTNTGDLHRIAEGVGAHLTLMEHAWWFPVIDGPDGPGVVLSDRSLPGSFIVDASGKRFMNESVDYMSAGQIMLGQTDGAPARFPAWLIFDQAYRNKYMFSATNPPRADLPKAWYEAGTAFKATSFDELATLIGADELTTTAQRFNLLAGQGHDDDFSRGLSMYDHFYGDPTVTPNPNLAPLLKAPFYAVKIAPGDLGTCGGIAADERGRALREDGSVIQGLYAVGNAAGNVFGAFYPGPGCTIGQGLAYSYIAARHAAGLLD